MNLGIIIDFLFRVIMRALLIILSLLFSSLSFASLNDGIYALIKTNKGEIIVELAYEKAPLTVINFIALSEGSKKSNKELGIPFYDGITFHRVIDDFMIQGGDPQGDGRGGPGYQFVDEFSDLKHDQPGVLSMANSGPNTNGSQFFITHVPTPWLDGKHSVFGFVTEGMNVVNSIEKGDIIESISIKRIGNKANQFVANEDSFNSLILRANEQIIAQKKLQQAEFAEYVSLLVGDLNNELGYFSVIDKKGNGVKATNGQKVTVDIAVYIDNGEILQPPGSPFSFILGKGEIVSIIENNVQEMFTGEERTVIAIAESIFGPPSEKIPQGSYAILQFILIAAEDN